MQSVFTGPMMIGYALAIAFEILFPFVLGASVSAFLDAAPDAMVIVAPDGRVRVAELASSMLAATPLAAIAAGTAAASGWFSGAQGDFTAISALFGLVLLAVWGVLGMSKLQETKPLNQRANRLTNFGIGASIAAALIALQQWAHLDIGPVRESIASNQLTQYIGPMAEGAWPAIVELAAVFGLGFGLVGWWKQTDRARSARLRFAPLVTTALIAAVVAGLGHGGPAQTWGPPVLISAAIITQLVSPRDRQAAAYARWAKKNKVVVA